MDEPKTNETEPAQLNPVCPYCSADPLKISIRDLPFPNGAVAMIAFCANPQCRKLLPASFKGMMGSRIVPSSGAGRIIH